MNSTILRLLNIRETEWRLVFALLAVLAINTIVLELSDVVATAGFVSNLGAEQIPWLWIIDMVMALIVASLFALVIDRMPRLRLLSWMIGGLAVVYLLLLAMFRTDMPDWMTYPTLYIVADQQFMVFPLVFWALVNDVYTMSQAKRLIPLIGVGVAFGSIVGNILPALSAILISRRGGDSTYLFALGIVLLLVSLIILRLAFRSRTIRARQSTSGEGDLRQTIHVGIDYFTNLRVFHYLGIAMLLIGLALTIIEFNLLYMVQKTFTTSLGFQIFYGVYKTVLIVVLVVFQGLVTGRLLQKIPLKNAFPGLPATLLVASTCALLLPSLAGAAISRFLARFVERAWDEPTRKATLALVPDERRGRISTFLDTYFFTVATIVGSAILLIFLQTGDQVSDSFVTYSYLVIAGLASMGAIWASLQARASYDSSLLNWRLSRSRRKSALDGIDF